MYIKQITFVLLFLLYNCASLSQKFPEITEKGEQFVLYTIAKPDFILANSEVSNRIQFTQKSSPGFSSNFIEESFRNILSVKSGTVFSAEITETLVKAAMPHLNENKILYGIVIYPDNLSNFTRINRVTFYCFYDATGLNLVFDEIFQNIDFTRPYGFNDWSQKAHFTIKPVKKINLSWPAKFNNHFRLYSGQNKTGMSYNWIILSENEFPGIVKPDDSIERKLKQLKDFKERGLIDDEAYKEKVREILKGI